MDGVGEFYDRKTGEQFVPRGANFDLHLPSGVQANLVFFRDFAQAPIDRGAPLEAIFAYGLRNELFFESSLPPLSLASGVVRTANGNLYAMASRRTSDA